MNTRPLRINTWNFGHTRTERRSQRWREQCMLLRAYYTHTHTHVHSTFHPIYRRHAHTKKNTHKPSLSSEARFSGPHWLSSKCLGASGIQFAFGASIRYSDLTLTVTVTVTARPPAHTPSAWEDQTTLKKGQDPPPPLPPRSHCSDCCCCCFKGVFVQKCSFYDCYYNYCYDYLIKDLYHTGKKNGKDFS